MSREWIEGWIAEAGDERTRAARARLRDPGCGSCQDMATGEGTYWPEGFGPSHTASPRCESGGHNHCTCDGCF